MAFVKIPKINTAKVKKVKQLADRPNRNQQIGTHGLSAADLKKYFDSFSEEIAKTLNDFIDAISGEKKVKFIDSEGSESEVASGALHINVPGYESLYDFFEDISLGKFASNLYLSEKEETLQSFFGLYKNLASNYNNFLKIYDDFIFNLESGLASGTAVMDSKGKPETAKTLLLYPSAANPFGEDKSLTLFEAFGECLDKIKSNLEEITNLKKNLTTLDTSVGILNADSKTEGSVSYKIAQALSAILDNDSESLNSLHELVDWIENHADEAIKLTNRISEAERVIEDEIKPDIESTKETLQSTSLSASENKANILTLTSRVSDTEKQLAAHEKQLGDNTILITEHYKRIENLEGATLDVVEDSEVAYRKIVPEGVQKYALISKIGGMSYSNS